MGTKSKNNKGRKQIEDAKNQKKKGMAPGYAVAFILILAATLTFLLQYPSFQARVTVDEPDILSGSEFTHEIYQANMVLYKEVRENAAGKTIYYRDIYLTAEEEAAESEAFDKYYNFGNDTPLTFAGEYLENLLKEWDNTFCDGLATQLDYKIIDHESQNFLANTSRDLMRLGTEEADYELNAYYPYYIKLNFDEEGRLAHVWAKGEDVDALITKVQNVMRSRYLERSLYENLSYSPYADVDWEDDIYYSNVNNDEVKQMRLSVANTPRNCTICYALTGEQLAEVKASSRVFLSMQSVGNYNNIGVQELFRAILLVLGMAALILPFWKSYHLHEQLFLPLHIETVVALLFCGFSVFGALSASLVMYSVSDRWDYSFAYMLHSVLPGLSEAEAQAIVVVGNFLLLLLVFSLWYFLVTLLGQAYVLGIRNYFRKRCLCYRLFRHVRILFCRKRARMNRNFEHMDLEQDMNIPLLKLLGINYLIIALICLFWVLALVPLALYTVWLYFFLRKRIRVVQEKYDFLLDATRSLADGNLQTEFTGDWGMFESFKEDLSEIQTGFSKAVEEEVKSQRMRTELITNVSHDLKTPLTAIITYIDLMQEEGVTEKQREEYLEVLERKSLRLKALIEDLFEVSKASSGNVTFHAEKVDICNLVRQVYLEYEDRAGEADLTFRFAIPDKKLFLMLDGEKTSRIFDNLYINIIKYAMPHTRVYVTVEEREDEVSIELKNISGSELNVPPENLTDRFVRGDSARSSEGSGLGLAIARSFVELQGGRMDISVDGDLFKVVLVWKKIQAAFQPSS